MKSLILSALLISAAFLRAEKPAEFVITPSTGEGPFPVALWLHGLSRIFSNGIFSGESREAMQKHADLLGAVIIGFPATTDLGDNTQQWSEETVADHAYIQTRLKKIAATSKLDLTRVGLFGFSQGAMVAADLASCYPESYRGAILMSPGGFGEPQAARIKSPAHADQIYYSFCGGRGKPGQCSVDQGLRAASGNHPRCPGHS